MSKYFSISQYIVRSKNVKFYFTKKDKALDRLELLEKYFPGQFELVKKKIAVSKELKQGNL